MTWMACPQRMFSDPLTGRFAAKMGWKITTAGGAILRLWCWCLEFAPDGDLRPYTPGEISTAMGEPAARGEKIVLALLETGWLERSPYFRVHDWWKIAGLFLQGRFKRQPEVWREIERHYRKSGRKSGPAHPEKKDSPKGLRPAREPLQSLSRAAPEQLPPTGSDPTVSNQISPPHLPRGEAEDGGMRRLKRSIYYAAGERRFSRSEEDHLKTLLESHGAQAIDACTLLHSGIRNVPAYLHSVLEGKDHVGELTRRVEAILKRGESG